MDKNYVIPTAQEFKSVGKRLLDDISENIKIVDNDLWKEFCAFPNMEIDDYIAKCVKARRGAFNTTLKKYKALQWLIKQQGFIKSFGTALDDYLYGNTKKRVTSLLTEDIQSYYKLFQNPLDIVSNMDIYQLQQNYLEKAITYIPYHEGCSTNADHAGFFYYSLTHKKIFELISNLCDFYGNWLEGLYSKKASYIKRDLIDLKKSLKKIHTIINNPHFVDCFPKDLLSNILPSCDVKRQAIVQNSIHYLEQLIEQHKKVGLKKDNYLERRLKIQDITKIILKSLPKDQLTDNTKLEHIVFEMMTIPIITVGSVEEKLTEKSIRDCFKKLDIKLEQNEKNISIYIESDEDFSKLTEDQIEFYKEYIRLNR